MGKNPNTCQIIFSVLLADMHFSREYLLLYLACFFFLTYIKSDDGIQYIFLGPI